MTFQSSRNINCNQTGQCIETVYTWQISSGKSHYSLNPWFYRFDKFTGSEFQSILRSDKTLYLSYTIWRQQLYVIKAGARRKTAWTSLNRPGFTGDCFVWVKPPWPKSICWNNPRRRARTGHSPREKRRVLRVTAWNKNRFYSRDWKAHRLLPPVAPGTGLGATV